MAVGDLYFVWVDSTETFDPVTHRRSDESVLRVEIDETEGSLAMMSVWVPRFSGGPLASGRKRHAFLSREQYDGSLKLIAAGRLIAWPISSADAAVRLDFLCAPDDWQDRQAAALAPLKSPPAFDPVLVPRERRDDPTEILDGYASLAHVHRATGTVSVASILGLGLPLLDLGDSWLDGTFTAEIAEPPIDAVNVRVEAQWIQSAWGSLLIKNNIDDAFAEGQPNTLTPDDFEQRWPREGDPVGGDSGYVIVESKLRRVAGSPDLSAEFHGSSEIYSYVQDSQLPAAEARPVRFERAWYDADLKIAWSHEQKRREVVTFTLTNGCQEISLSQGGTRDLRLYCEDVTIDEITPEWRPGNFYSVDAEVRYGGRNYRCNVEHTSSDNFLSDYIYRDEDGVVTQRWDQLDTDNSPIGGKSKDTYFLQPRGEQTLLAAILKARAILAESQRCVEISFEVPARDVLDITCAHRVRITAPADMLPGGVAEGKVYSYRMVTDGDSGEDSCTITMRCAIGSGAAGSPGSGGSVNASGEDWDMIGYEDYSDQQAEPFPVVGADVDVYNSVAEQESYVKANDYTSGADPVLTDPARLLGEVPTRIVIRLTPLAGRDEMTNEIDVSLAAPWRGPRQIDLEAAP